MDSNRYNIARGAFLAIASLLIGFGFTNSVEAAYVKIEPQNDWVLNGAYWELELSGSEFTGATFSNSVAHKPFCVGTQYDSCGGGPSTNSLSSSASTFEVGFATSTNQTSGTYYYVFSFLNPGSNYNNCSSKNCYYFTYEWDNTAKTPTTPFEFNAIGFNSVTNTRFTDLDLTGTSTINIGVQYFLDENEIEPTVSAFNPTLVQFRYALNPDTEFSTQSESINNSVFGTSTIDTNLSGLADGVYDLNIIFSNQGVLFGEDRPFPKSYIYTSFEISGGVLIATSSVEYYNGLTPEDPERYQPCSLTELSGCLTNSMLYLFYPSTQSITEIYDLYDTLSTKFPFAYFTDFNDSISGLYTGSQTATSTITVPFGDFGNITLISASQISAVPFTSTVRSLLGALIWLMLAATIYRRTQKIFNPHQETTV